MTRPHATPRSDPSPASDGPVEESPRGVWSSEEDEAQIELRRAEARRLELYELERAADEGMPEPSLEQRRARAHAEGDRTDA